MLGPTLHLLREFLAHILSSSYWIKLTSCKRFDNYCYHPQCIAKELQFFCYALRMITVVIETFTRCQLYRLLWPWYLLLDKCIHFLSSHPAQLLLLKMYRYCYVTVHIMFEQGLRMRNCTWNWFLLKICWSIPCLHPSLKVHTWIEISASLKHRKKTKADGSRLIPQKHTETLELSSVTLIQ